MALAADQGLALFAGLNAVPKKSFLSEYSHRLERRHTLRLLGAWQDKLAGGDRLLGLFSLAQVGVRVAEDVRARVLSQEGENARLAARAHCDVVLLDDRGVEEANRIGERILDEHPLGVARDHLLHGPGPLVGEQDRRLLVAEILDEELPKRALRDRHGLLENPRRVVPASDVLSSSVAMKVDFGLALLVVASGLYRRRARRMRGYSEAHQKQRLVGCDLAIEEVTHPASLPLSGAFRKHEIASPLAVQG